MMSRIGHEDEDEDDVDDVDDQDDEDEDDVAAGYVLLMIIGQLQQEFSDIRQISNMH